MKKSEINGLFIYKNKNNQNVFYDVLTKNAYIVDKANEDKYRVYQAIPIIGIMVALALIYYLKFGIIKGIVVGFMLCVILYILLRILWLNKLQVDKKFVKYKKDNYALRISKRAKNKSSLVLMILFAFIILMVSIYAIINGKDATIDILVCYAVAVFAIVFIGIYSLALYYKNRK